MEKKLYIKELIIYMGAQFGGNIPNLVFVAWIMRFYTLPDNKSGTILVPISWIGGALVAGRIVDALADPLIGYWSDNTKTRLGRRRPFIIIGAPLLSVCFFVLFYPLFPAGSAILIGFTVVMMSLFWFFFTVIMVPYLSLMPEIAVSTDERVKISTGWALIMILCQVIALVAVPIIIEKYGFTFMALSLSLVAAIFVLITGVFTKEKYISETTSEKKPGFFYEFKTTLSNRAFLIYITTSLTLYMGFTSLTSSLAIINKVLLKKEDSFMAVIGGVSLLFISLGFIVINILVKSKKYEKSIIFRKSILVMAIFFPFLFFIGQVPLPISPLCAVFVFIALTAVPIAAVQILPSAILADIIDYDEKITGKRREGIYFSAQGFLQKLATALSLGVMTILFRYFGYSEGNHLGINLIGPIGGVFALLGYIIFCGYPLDEKKKELKN